MKLFVLDVSVAVKWFLPRSGETLVEEAFHVLQDYTDQRIDFVVPDLFRAEFGNVLWKGVGRNRLRAETAAEAVDQIKVWELQTVRSEEVLGDAFALALATGQTVYDSLYIAVAIRSGCEMITADERLAQAVGSRLPVRWLGSL